MPAISRYLPRATEKFRRTARNQFDSSFVFRVAEAGWWVAAAIVFPSRAVEIPHASVEVHTRIKPAVSVERESVRPTWNNSARGRIKNHRSLWEEFTRNRSRTWGQGTRYEPSGGARLPNNENRNECQHHQRGDYLCRLELRALEQSVRQRSDSLSPREEAFDRFGHSLWFLNRGGVSGLRELHEVDQALPHRE